ncbi:MAG: VOC family protein [Anaerolineae bacterium]|nr:VOC family protein [Anaerolineae bacterium]
MKYVGPLMVVEDMKRARHFYEQVLEQQVSIDFGENVGYKGGLSIHRKAHFQELLGDPTRYPIVSKAHNGELYFESDEIEALLCRLKEHSVEFISEIQEQPWGQRVMRFYDPDGHIIEVGEPIASTVLRMHKQGASNREIVKKTGMPAEFVEKAVTEGK